jgi:hypothetical protein
MTSILLGPLAQSNKLNSIYNSDMESNMRNIEANQAKKQFYKPEYLSQFDELRLDNIGAPVGVNETNKSITGVNLTLQRNIDFQMGFSEFQNTDMHYDVVTVNDFGHKNMVPFTSRRDFSKHAQSSQRKLETFTGISDSYVAKREKVPLFEPVSNLTNPFGMPVITDKVVNRFIPSNKNNNGDLPFSNQIRVKPGIGKDNQEGRYSVYRIIPKNVDDLRTDINKKITYDNKPLETNKKGDVRGPDPYLTKYKLPDFREQKFSDLLPNKAVQGGNLQTGKYTNVTSQRNQSEIYVPGIAVNVNKGNGPDKNKTNFELSKKENYYNDSTRGIQDINNKPVMTNIKSYTNYENQRATSNIEYTAPIGNSSQQGNYVIDYTNSIPLVTLRELMINGDTVTTGINSIQHQNYVFSNDMVLPITKRQIICADTHLGPNGDFKVNQAVNYNDIAKPTLRQNTYHDIVTNNAPTDKLGYTGLTDKAKATIRPEISHNIVTNNTPIDKTSYSNLTDNARATLRPETSHNIITNNNPIDKTSYSNLTDNARATIRPETSHNIITNNNPIDKTSYSNLTDNARATIRPETSYNIVTNYTPVDKTSYVGLTDNAKATLRPEMSHNIITNNAPVEKTSYANITDNAKPTIRPETSHNIITNNAPVDKTSYSNLTDKAKATIRPETSHNIITNNNPIDKNVYTSLSDTAKNTIRQQTNHNIITNNTPVDKTGYANITDMAKATLRPETSHNIITNNNPIDKTVYSNLTDKAKPTIKESTTYNIQAGRMNNSDRGNYTSIDEARPTIKQTVLLKDYTGGIKHHDKIISREAAENMEMDDRREIAVSTFYIPPGKKDANGPYIDVDNVQLNNPVMYSYVSHPHKDLDYSVMPIASQNTIESCYLSSRPIVETSNYYINPNFINTLNDNPFVNDIYHQKNY